jgi:hypothetical protein
VKAASDVNENATRRTKAMTKFVAIVEIDIFI